jgi:Holliday junction resolvase RusA-like endonuclease
MNTLSLPGVGVELEPGPPTRTLRRYEFFAAGEPKGMGSKTAFAYIPKGGGKPRAVVTDAAAMGRSDAGKRMLAWKDCVIAATMAELGDNPQRIMGAVRVSLTFFLARPVGHHGKNGLRPSAPPFPSVKPDLDKLARSTLDALAVVMLSDDSRVVELALAKRYADSGPTGAQITVEELG